jgi:hypothetical protein
MRGHHPIEHAFEVRRRNRVEIATARSPGERDDASIGRSHGDPRNGRARRVRRFRFEPGEKRRLAFAMHDGVDERMRVEKRHAVVWHLGTAEDHARARRSLFELAGNRQRQLDVPAIRAEAGDVRAVEMRREPLDRTAAEQRKPELIPLRIAGVAPHVRFEQARRIRQKGERGCADCRVPTAPATATAWAPLPVEAAEAHEADVDVAVVAVVTIVAIDHAASTIGDSGVRASTRVSG